MCTVFNDDRILFWGSYEGDLGISEGLNRVIFIWDIFNWVGLLDGVESPGAAFCLCNFCFVMQYVA